MTNRDEARFDVLSVTLQELLRSLSPQQAQAVAEAVRQRLAASCAGLSPREDFAVAQEAGPLLGALAR
jgi:hypothetical protein